MTTRRQSLAPAALLGALAIVVHVAVIGCASPGPPRPPTLQLPAPVKDMTALRHGNTVELRFSLPHNTSDGVPLRTSWITATACRAIGPAPCRLIPLSRTYPLPSVGDSAEAELTDTLPIDLATGAPRLLAYRVQLANDRGKTAGYSDPAYTAAGAPPATVSGLQAQGSRLGVVLTWQPTEDDGSRVVLRREDLNPATTKPASGAVRQPAKASATSPVKHHAKGGAKTAPANPGPVSEANVTLLSTGEESGKPQGAATLDTTALTEEPYRYTAERRRTLELDGHSMQLRSSVSAQVEFTLHDVFPPPAPEDLNLAAYADEKGNYSIDLVWQPVSDPSLAGYNVYRQSLSASGAPAGPKTRLNESPLPLPAYHDKTAVPSQKYQYSVTALDKKGNESSAATATVVPVPQ